MDSSREDAFVISYPLCLSVNINHHELGEKILANFS